MKITSQTIYLTIHPSICIYAQRADWNHAHLMLIIFLSGGVWVTFF